jgi:DNA primase
MSIDFDKFLSWAESRFDDVSVRGNEIIVNSIFCEDRKRHLWCNPSGGKTGCKSGVYHCWKSEQSGSLVGLVMLVDKCSYDEAVEILDAPSEGSLQDLERRVNDIFEKKPQHIDEDDPPKSLKIPESCYLFDELPSYNETRILAIDYLKSRKINPSGLFVCTRGRYRNRIVIPYYDKNGNLFYYNGRYIGDSGKNLRYLGPPKELGIGKGDVIFVPEWPRDGEKIYITEGEFDALALRSAGFYSAALGGKSMSEKQRYMVSPYKPVLCLDADQAGGKATFEIAKFMMSRGIIGINYVRPCVEYKDWNGLLVSKGPKILAAYINSQEKEYNSMPGVGDWEGIRLKMNEMIN